MKNMTIEEQIKELESQGKKYRLETKTGIPCRIYAFDGAENEEIHGAMFENGKWHCETWSSYGLYFEEYTQNRLNLIVIEVK